MKTYILIFVLLLSTLGSNAEEDLTLKFRKLFEEAASNETSANTLNSLTAQYTTASKSIYYGYKGISEMMLCNYTANVYKKLSYFNSGKKILEEAIKLDPTNIELKFLRFCIQKNTPSFLGYNDNIKTDEVEINKYIADINSDPVLVSFIQTNKAKIKN
jgi:hypothetical protein